MIARCTNLSLNDDIREKFYKGENDFIFIKEKDIINGFVKLLSSKKLPIRRDTWQN